MRPTPCRSRSRWPDPPWPRPSRSAASPGQGADVPLAGWSLLAGGVASSAAAALVVVGGGLASGNILVTALAVPGGVLAIAALVIARAAARRPRLRGALERPAAWTLRQGSRLLRRPGTEPGKIIR